MGVNFSTARNAELSTLAYVKTQLEANWSGITVVKTFQQAYDTAINPPIVSVRLEDIQATRKEVGGLALIETYTLAIDIFARSDGQRIDLAAFILGKLKDGWTYNVYSHPSGDNSTLQTSPSGRVFVTTFIQNGPIDLGETVNVKDKFRHLITVQTQVGVA